MYINVYKSNIQIYLYLTMVYLYNHARVQPELACPKLDLVLHHMLQAFRPQMPGTGHTSKPRSSGLSGVPPLRALKMIKMKNFK